MIERIEIEGHEAYRIEDGEIEAIVTSLGAGLYSLRYKGVMMVMAPKYYKDYASSEAYFGKTVGRIAGRIKGGELLYEGKLYHIATNEKGNSLHGGPNGFSFRSFDAKIDGKTLVLSLISKDGDNGYPGNLSLEVRYTVENNALKTVFLTSSDIDTPVNITNHSYFTLGEPSCLSLSLRLASSKVLTYNEDLSIKGEAEVSSCLDFRTAKKIGRDILDPSLYETSAQGYDACYILDERKEGEVPLTLCSDKVKMEIDTSYPSIVVYSSNYADGSIMGNDGKMLRPRSSLALEPEYPGNDLGAMSVKKGETKTDFITYSFTEGK